MPLTAMSRSMRSSIKASSSVLRTQARPMIVPQMFKACADRDEAAALR
jgi:hypothetical protein